MAELTVLRSVDTALRNARENHPYIKRTIAELSEGARPDRPRGSAIVIGAGPSLHRRQPVAQIRASGYQGTIVAADAALGHCLRSGLVPDYVVTLDPHPTRVCRWFGDTELESRRNDDDYFQRQEMDPYLGANEVERNRELIELVNRHGSALRAIICTSVAPNVTKRCLESRMQLYWWNPLMDDIERSESVTRELFRMNGAPCMVSGGNVGTAAWVVATQVLGHQEVALVGMDFGYAPGTMIQQTQYYRELVELFGKRAPEAMIPVRNPYLKEDWVTDPAYYWYRECFLQLVAQSSSITHNCTAGGIMFGKAVRWTPLEQFLGARVPRVAVSVG